MQAGWDVLWLAMTAPPRVHGRSWSATWHTPPALIPHYNAALQAASMLRPPHGPALLLDLHALAESERALALALALARLARLGRAAHAGPARW